MPLSPRSVRGRAVVLRDARSAPRVETVEVAAPLQGEVRVRVAASGICGSDLHVLHGRGGSTTLPMILGHEGAGVVESVGPDVDAVAVGDHVVLALYGPCGACPKCLHGRFVLCSGTARQAAVGGRMADGSTRVAGESGEPLYPMVGLGTLADYVVVRAAQLVVIDPTVPLDRACLIGCGVTTGVGAAINGGVLRPGDTAAVFGCGGVGLSVVQGARIAGATTIVALDVNDDRLDLARRLGATATVNTSAEDPLDAIARFVPGGVDTAFEVVGSVELIDVALRSTAPGGTCVMVGAPPPGVLLEFDPRVLFTERRLVGSIAGGSVPGVDIPRNVAFYRSGALRLDVLVPRTWDLAAFGAAVAAAEQGLVPRAVVTTRCEQSGSLGNQARCGVRA